MVHGFTLQRFEQMLASHHADVIDGRLVAPGTALVSKPLYRDAVATFMPMHMAKQEGKPFGCDVSRCKRNATEAVYGAHVCDAHGPEGEPYPAVTEAEPVMWWELPKVGITDAGAELLGVAPLPPELRSVVKRPR